MIEDFKLLILGVAYFSLLVELLFFPVPSVASTYQLVLVDDTGKKTSSRFDRIKHWQVWKKVLFLIIPAVVNVAVFLFPFFMLLGIFEYQIISNQPLSLGVGILLVIFGRLITFLSIIQIRKINRSSNQQKFLHQKGWFKWSRNPGLLGMYMFIFGVWCFFSHPLFLVGILFYMTYMHFKILLEEDYLIEKFGKTYQEYLKQTKRYL